MKLIEIERKPLNLTGIKWTAEDLFFTENKYIEYATSVKLTEVSDVELDVLKKMSKNTRADATMAYGEALERLKKYDESCSYVAGERRHRAWFEPTKIIFNPPATIVFWKDGTKTVVKCQDGDIFNEEVGLAMAIAQKIAGNRSKYKKMVDGAVRQKEGDA